MFTTCESIVYSHVLSFFLFYFFCCFYFTFFLVSSAKLKSIHEVLIIPRVAGMPHVAI